MKISKFICCLPMLLGLNVAFAQSKPSLVKQTLENTPMRGGSGVGGGVIYDSVLSWCQDAGEILSASKDSALEEISVNGNPIGALKILYQDGLIRASEVFGRDEAQMMTTNSMTFQYISRGIKLSNILGVKKILDGDVNSEIHGQKNIDSLNTILDWYITHIIKDVITLDKKNASLYLCPDKNCKEINDLSLKEKERLMIKSLSMFLKKIEPRFVYLSSDKTNYYTTISTDHFFKILSFTLNSAGKDLRESIYANAYDCHANKADSLAKSVESYSLNRAEGQRDAYMLNKFTLELRELIKKIDNGNCY